MRRASGRGIALVLVLGVLALMSALALSLVSLTRLERKISQNYVDQVRAKMAAESGVEGAVAKLSTVIGTPVNSQLEWMTCGRNEAPELTLADVSVPSFAIDWNGDGALDCASGVVGSSHAQNGDVVLLSPGCASFDLFKNYKERGALFKKEVRSL